MEDSIYEFVSAGIEFAHANNEYKQLKHDLHVARRENDDSLVETLTEQISFFRIELDEYKKQLLKTACALTGDDEEEYKEDE